MYDADRFLHRGIDPGRVVQGDGLGAHALSPDDGIYQLAGIVTTGAAPLTPVSAIESNSMMISKVYLDWMSVSAIQYHLLLYCAAT